MKTRDRINANTYGTPIPRFNTYSITDDGRVFRWTPIYNKITGLETHRWERCKTFRHEDGTVCAVVGEVHKMHKGRKPIVSKFCAEVRPGRVAKIVPVWVLMHLAHFGFYPAKLKPHYVNGDQRDNSLRNLRFLPIKPKPNQMPAMKKPDLSMGAPGRKPEIKLVKSDK